MDTGGRRKRNIKRYKNSAYTGVPVAALSIYRYIAECGQRWLDNFGQIQVTARSPAKHRTEMMIISSIPIDEDMHVIAAPFIVT
jgi:hypothetical protein